jgi:hypothetical protein
MKQSDVVLFHSEEEVVSAYVAEMAKKFPLLGEARVRLAFAAEIRSLRRAWQAWAEACHRDRRPAFAVAAEGVRCANSAQRGTRHRGGARGA